MNTGDPVEMTKHINALKLENEKLRTENAELNDDNESLVRWAEKFNRDVKVDFEVKLMYVGIVSAIIWGNIGCFVMYRGQR